jgi:hypothetical protein
MPRLSSEARQSALRHRIRTLDRERAACLNAVLDLKDLFAASLSVVHRTCGKKTCTCRRGKPHGPYFFLSIQSAGRNDRYHVSGEEAERMKPALERYRRFVLALRRLRSLGREIELLVRRLQSLCETRSVKSFTTS